MRRSAPEEDREETARRTAIFRARGCAARGSCLFARGFPRPKTVFRQRTFIRLAQRAAFATAMDSATHPRVPATAAKTAASATPVWTLSRLARALLFRTRSAGRTAIA